MTKKKIQTPKKQTKNRFENFAFLTIMGVASSISGFYQICLIFNTENAEVIFFRFFSERKKLCLNDFEEVSDKKKSILTIDTHFQDNS